MKKFFLVFLVLAFQFCFSQKSRNVGDFNSLKVYDKIHVELVPSEASKVEISGDEENVELVNKNGELKIRMITTKLLQGDEITVTVFYENLNDIQASQGSTINAKDVLESPSLNLTSNEGSKISADIQTEQLNAKTNSGGIIVVSGKANNQDIVANSGGKFLGKDLESENATVAVNAGGIADVNTSESVNATTRAGGVINVYGDPSEKNTQNILGGKINFK